MTYLITFLLTLGVVLAAMWVFVKVGTPVYRIDRSNVIALLELVLSGEATENDWHVFIGIPLRHDNELRELQKHCELVAETEFTGLKGNMLFTAKGLAELEMLLQSLLLEESEAVAQYEDKNKLKQKGSSALTRERGNQSDEKNEKQ